MSGSFLERLQQSRIYFEISTTVADFDVRLRDAMKIAASRHQKTEPLCHLQVTRGLRFAVGAVMYFNALKASLLECPHAGPKTLTSFLDPGRVGQHRHALGFSDPSDGLRRGRQFARDIGRLSLCEEAIEGLFGRCDVRGGEGPCWNGGSWASSHRAGAHAEEICHVCQRGLRSVPR